MNQSKHIKLFSGSFIEVQRVQLDLNDAEIPFIVKNNRESARLGGYGNLGTNVELFIFEEDYERAKTIIDKLEAEIN